MSLGCTLAWSGAAHFTACCLGLPATSLQPNTVGQSGTSGAQGKHHRTLHQAHAGAGQTLQPPSSLGRAKSFPPTCKQNLVLEKRAMPHRACTQGVWKDARACIHGTDAQKQPMPGYREHKHTRMDTQARTMMAATTAPLSEQQLIPLGLLPPHRLARGGMFLCHKHSGRASAACTAAAQLGLPGLLSSSAHATKPRLLLCFCRLLQHLPPNIPTAPALCDLPISNPSNCPAFSTAFLQTLRHFS